MARVTSIAAFSCPCCLKEDTPEQGRQCVRCQGDPWPEDTLIRSVGFSIQRRGRGQAVWRTPGWMLLAHDHALSEATTIRGKR